MAKKKKEKTVYYDDNSTISDMSNVTKLGKKAPPPQPKIQSSAKEKWKTYWSAVRRMLLPMCFVLLVITVLYFLLIMVARCAA